MMKNTIAIIYLILASLLAVRASASEVVESFDTKAKFESGNLIWNQALSKAHPRLQIQGWDNGGGATNTLFAVGDGSQGPFQRSTYTLFDPNANDTNKVIRINTDAYPILNFTKFELDFGWKIIPTGSKPLKIYSLSTVIINGEIQCQGDAGQSPTGGSRLIPGLGGSARCGGASGGSGGQRYTGTLADASGEAGLSPDGNITGGQPGTVTALVTTGAGGGGGGAFADEGPQFIGKNGAGNNSVGGANGTNFIDHAFAIISGGAGGGGGSGSSSEAGAGGGAGGGVVIIHAVGDVTVGTSGFVLAHGGNGADTAGDGGAGGAGGGGSIQIFAGGNFLMQAPAGIVIDARKGTPGQSLASAGTDGDGGVAYFGRTWLSVGVYDAANTASYLPGEAAAMTVGDARYEVATESLISKSYDSLSTLAEFTALAVSSNAPGQVTVDISGSNDNFVSDDTGWKSSAQVADISNKRFFKFKLSINNNSATVPVVVNDVTVTYAKGLMKDFDFKAGAGCGLIKNSSGSKPGPLSLLFLLLPFVFYRALRISRN